jgi:argininosuccinate lyase
MYRLVLREKLLSLLSRLLRLQAALLELSEEHCHTLMPAHTHTQPAQPTTFAHYLMAVWDGLHREGERLWKAYLTVNRSPMGAGH